MEQEKKALSLSHFLRRVVRVLRETIEGIEEYEIASRAAAISYYGLLSLFPMLLFLVYLASQFLESEEARLAINKSLVQVLPAGQLQHAVLPCAIPLRFFLR